MVTTFLIGLIIGIMACGVKDTALRISVDTHELNIQWTGDGYGVGGSDFSNNDALEDAMRSQADALDKVDMSVSKDAWRETFINPCTR